MGYSKKFLTGISWLWALNLSSKAVSFLTSILIARILTPSEFGVYGVAILVMALLEILTETGINVVIIQEKNNLEKYINSAWIVSIIRGLVIFLLILLLAPVVSSFFNADEILNLMVIISLVPLLRGFINPAEIKFQKDLNFHKEFLYRFVILVFGFIVALIFLTLTQSVVSLALGLIASSLLQIFLSFQFISPKPRLSIEKGYFSKILNKGKWVTLSGIFNYLFHNFDNIVVGRLLGTYSLGLYEMAYKISMLPITGIADVISKVTFPVYSKIADDKKRLRNAFIKTLISVSLIILPFGVILISFPKEIVEITLGSKWLGMVEVLRILVIFGVIRAISGLSSALFLSVGKQKYVTIVTLVSIIGLALTVVPLVINLGIFGAGLSALVGSLVALPFMIYFSVKILK